MAETKIWKSLAGGAIGGLIAALAMNQFQAIWSSVSHALSSPNESSQSSGGGEDATVKAAAGISETVFEHKLTDSEKAWAGPAVHYGFGTITGAVYGVLAETVPAVTAGRGTAYGSLVWLLGDEVAVPAFRLSAPATNAPLSSHISALAAHLVYGFVTDFVRRTAV